ncbi:unnamed protein product [Haemonchus placei]|uniref:Uncharacterized protein n=1 Tax=Haemonchus placei TaxID=6290 RepID=A0A0N4X5S8_HAEPC|nr:unnamed protein product [Haemonchus placei]
MDAGEEPPEFVYEELRGSKRMLTMAKDSLGVAFWRLCPGEMTLIAEVYCQFLDSNIGNWMAAHNFKKTIIMTMLSPTHLELRNSFLKKRILKPGFNRRILPTSSRATSPASVK